MPHVRVRARTALLTVAVSAVALGACADEADDPGRAELQPVAQSRAPDTPVLDRRSALAREVRERPRRPKRGRSAGDGVHKAPGGGGATRTFVRSPAPRPTRPAPAPTPSPAPRRQPAATPSKPPAGGGQARAKPREVVCSPRCP